MSNNGKCNQHHLIPKQRGGIRKRDNLLKIQIEKHVAWHLIFGNRTLREVISFLKRLERIKKRQGEINDGESTL